MPDFRIIACEACGTEGRIYSGHPNDPNPRDCGPCPQCEGTGGEVVMVQPIDDYDHAEALEQKAERFERLIGEYRDA